MKHIPCAEMVRFGKNGTDATSAAVRLARAATQRDRLMLLGYHGWQDWYIGATTRNLGVPASRVGALAPCALRRSCSDRCAVQASTPASSPPSSWSR